MQPQPQAGPAASQQQQQQARIAQQSSANAGTGEAMEAGSSEASDEADNIASKDKYIRGTRLVIGGWFQACRWVPPQLAAARSTPAIASSPPGVNPRVPIRPA